MGECSRSRRDFISHLPQELVVSILTQLPIRDAVKTSILSTKWRYQWANLTQLVFDQHDTNFSFVGDNQVAKTEFQDFISRFLLLHHAPIRNFKLITSDLKNPSDLDQWLLFLSRKPIKKLVLDVGGHQDPLLYTPPCIFLFQNLTRLKLCGFAVKPPPGFQGFPCLKYLTLDRDTISLEVVENLISSCPLLEKFKCRCIDQLALTVRAPNLRHLTVVASFEDLYLQNTPLLASLYIDFCEKVLEAIILVKVPLTFDCLKFIDLRGITFENMNKAYVLHLLLQSPNLQKLKVWTAVFGWARFQDADADLEFWERECPPDFAFKQLKIVDMEGVYTENDVEFIKFVLPRSPVLEVMTIWVDRREMEMADEVLHLQRACPKIDVQLF
ncbi:F-box/FBD/LRR-repeat protein [Heracleum sosnowskyi]|uniref:F-box/FBD/LRR-repeat protein n=1 Tax=Heracleum sosnowskyi TaxID=360622 RepID=A0AAD8HPU1_9APIA|nr:F-box/FBD/LRR-repeat protein [Heracleum sosnowskyi]